MCYHIGTCSIERILAVARFLKKVNIKVAFDWKVWTAHLSLSPAVSIQKGGELG